MKRNTFTVVAAFIALLVVDSCPSTAAAPEAVMVFAAASTANAINDISTLFAARGSGKVVSSFGASSSLARQIEHGAPAQVFISADEEWMNYLSERKLIDAGTRTDLLGNRLVFVAPKDSPVTVEVGPSLKLAALLGDGRLVTGDPDHVPVGKYAKAALQKLGMWGEVENKLARAADVRAALALVERGEAPLGIVYATDAAVSTKVKVVGVFPEDSHPKIVYPSALVAGRATDAAKSFLAFLHGTEARAVFEKYGFTVR